jgi:serine/threonine-protein kinase RsbW
VAPRADQEAAVDQLRLAIPPDAGYIAMARMFAGSVARHYGCDEDVVEDVKVAVSEACTNSVKAHHDSGTAEPIELRARALDGELTFEIVDSGKGIDTEMQRAVEEGAATPATGLYEGSLGLTLIRSLFPGAEILRNDDRGTTVRFVVPVEPASNGIRGLPPLD